MKWTEEQRQILLNCDDMNEAMRLLDRSHAAICMYALNHSLPVPPKKGSRYYEHALRKWESQRATMRARSGAGTNGDGSE